MIGGYWLEEIESNKTYSKFSNHRQYGTRLVFIELSNVLRDELTKKPRVVTPKVAFDQQTQTTGYFVYKQGAT